MYLLFIVIVVLLLCIEFINFLLKNFVFSYIDDCNERHTIFPDKDFLGLCPNTGFVKVTSKSDFFHEKFMF